jgi:hypothetical protein
LLKLRASYKGTDVRGSPYPEYAEDAHAVGFGTINWANGAPAEGIEEMKTDTARRMVLSMAQ